MPTRATAALPLATVLTSMLAACVASPALAVVGAAMASAAIASEARTASDSEFLAHLQGCWTIDAQSREGGHYQMCFAPDGTVRLLSYNELFHEAFAEDAKYWLEGDELHIEPVSVELWPLFQSPHIACDARIVPEAELRLRDCGIDGISPEASGPGGAFSGRPWIFDGATNG
jgi:hypothetical protein